MLGMYLGDGCIQSFKHSKTYRLVLAMDIHYPNIAIETISALRVLFPNKKIRTTKQGNCLLVKVCSTKLVDYFPQHGKGHKHSRRIQLHDWQHCMMAAKFFLRGLIHSDGCFYFRSDGLPSYAFTNTSQDIQRIFQRTCDELDIEWTYCVLKPIGWGKALVGQTSICQQNSVEEMYELVGEKE